MSGKRKNPAAVALGKRSLKGRMEKTTPEQRSAIARKAVLVRWERYRQRQQAEQDAAL